VAGRLDFDLSTIVGAVSATVTSAASSICCIGPLAITLLGVNGAILGAAIKPYRPYLLAVAAVLLGFAFWRVFGPRMSAQGAGCSIRARKVQRIALWIGAATWMTAWLVGFAADRYWF
jgi:hypothetical protein